MNPIFSQSAQKPQISQNSINGIKSYMQMLKGSRNPQIMLQNMAMSNPQVKNVLEMCRGRNPQDVFMEQCRNMGYDPQEIINMLK